MNYALCNVARSYKFVGKYGVLNIHRKGSASKNFNPYKEVINYIYLLEVILVFVQDIIENKKILVNFTLFILSQKQLKKALSTSKDINNLFISCIDKVLKMSKISDELKNEIRKKGRQLKFIDYPF